jgi:LPXTG-motif cell wall-anchored protein
MRLSKNGKIVTAILTVRDLSKDPPPGGIANNYTMTWTFRGEEYQADAFVAPDGTVSYTAGPSDDMTDTTGRFNEGPNGTVEIDVPLDMIGKAKKNDIFRQPFGETDNGTFFVDRPASEFDYQVGQACSSAARAAQSNNSPSQVKGEKQVRGGVLPATGLADTPFSVAGLALIALAALTTRRLRLAR